LSGATPAARLDPDDDVGKPIEADREELMMIVLRRLFYVRKADILLGPHWVVSTQSRHQ